MLSRVDAKVSCMILRIISILILALSITSCGGAAPAPTQAPETEIPVTEPPAFQSVEAPTRQTPATATSTVLPTQILPTRTDTALPTLALPTEIINAPDRMVWDGVPTYPGESAPGYAFRVTYDPGLWALTNDQFGFPALGHRNIAACVIAVTTGRGLPPSLTVDHELVEAGEIMFDVSRVFENGDLKFVTYTGGDGTIFTGFQVDFQEQADVCLADALTVLSTLTSVPASQATPTP